MTDARAPGFTLFPQLAQELRLLIWEYHFSAPRIHVLHLNEDVARDSTEMQLACTTLDAGTNIPVLGYYRTDINSEARSVAQRLESRLDRVKDFASSVSISSILDRRVRDAPSANSPYQRVDVDWSTDLIYLCTPGSFLPFMGLPQRPWVGKIENLALAQPWFCSTPPVPGRDPGRYRIPFDGDLLRIAMDSFGSRLKNVLVILTPPPEVIEATVEDEGLDLEEEGRSPLMLDEYGFATMAAYLQGPGKKHSLDTAVDTSRVAIALEKQFQYSTRQDHTVTIKKCADIDLMQCCNGYYIRRQRLHGR